MTHPNPYDNVPTSDFDPYATEVLANPYPHYEQLRELGPWAWLERYGVLAVARHDEVQRILSQPDIFCSSAGVGLANFHTETPWRKPSIILEADPPPPQPHPQGGGARALARIDRTPARHFRGRGRAHGRRARGTRLVRRRQRTV